MTRRILGAAVLLITTGRGASSQTEFPELIGVDSVGVYVKEFKHNVLVAGIDSFAVRTQIEVALRSRGVRVHPVWNAPDSPKHYIAAEIQIVARPSAGVLAYLVVLSLNGPVRSMTTSRVLYIDIWNRSEVGIASIPEASARIRQAIERMTDLFTNNWLEANPR